MKYNFRPGDKVICIAYSLGFRRGGVYIVSLVDENTISVVEDSLGSTTNGWHKKWFVPYNKLLWLILN